jgi:hypothetical protein
MRALHGAIAGAAAGIGHTVTEAYTTEDGTQQQQQQQGGGAAGDAGVGRGHHKQQVFEDARKRLGATAGDLARSDALVLEAVLGEGTFGKVFKGEQDSAKCVVPNSVLWHKGVQSSLAMTRYYVAREWVCCSLQCAPLAWICMRCAMHAVERARRC